MSDQENVAQGQQREVPRERFIFEQDWPKPRTDEGEEVSHPETTRDDEPGPFLPNFWEGRDDRDDEDDDEIGYEGER